MVQMASPSLVLPKICTPNDLVGRGLSMSAATLLIKPRHCLQCSRCPTLRRSAASHSASEPGGRTRPAPARRPAKREAFAALAPWLSSTRAPLPHKSNQAVDDLNFDLQDLISSFDQVWQVSPTIIESSTTRRGKSAEFTRNLRRGGPPHAEGEGARAGEASASVLEPRARRSSRASGSFAILGVADMR